MKLNYCLEILVTTSASIQNCAKIQNKKLNETFLLVCVSVFFIFLFFTVVIMTPLGEQRERESFWHSKRTSEIKNRNKII